MQISVGLSLICLIFSLTQPAFYIDRKEDPNAYSDSLILFLLGWLSIVGGAFIPFVLWLANPLYLVAIFFTLKNKSSAIYFAFASSILAFTFSQLDTIVTKESGSSSVITSLGLGFKLWFISFIILTLGLIVNRFLTNKNRN